MKFPSNSENILNVILVYALHACQITLDLSSLQYFYLANNSGQAFTKGRAYRSKGSSLEMRNELIHRKTAPLVIDSSLNSGKSSAHNFPVMPSHEYYFYIISTALIARLEIFLNKEF